MKASSQGSNMQFTIVAQQKERKNCCALQYVPILSLYWLRQVTWSHRQRNTMLPCVQKGEPGTYSHTVLMSEVSQEISNRCFKFEERFFCLVCKDNSPGDIHLFSCSIAHTLSSLVQGTQSTSFMSNALSQYPSQYGHLLLCSRITS